MCRAWHFEDCEEGTARAIYSDWKSMKPILGTVHLPIPSMCFHVFTWSWSLATLEWSSDTHLWNSFFLSFIQTDSENEDSLLVAEAVSWHSWETLVVVFLTCVGCQIHKENEGDRQRSRDKSGGAGRQAFISSFPGLRKAQRCISLLTMDTPCPSNQALFCLATLRWVSVPWNPETSSKGLRRACCRAGEEDGGDQAGWRDFCGGTYGGTDLLGCGGGGCSVRGRGDGHPQISRDHCHDCD